MFCPNCGKENSPFAQFCENCGNSFQDVPADNSGVQQNNVSDQPMSYNNQQMDFNQQPLQVGFNQQPQQVGFNQQPLQVDFNQQPQQVGFNQQPLQVGFNQQPQQVGFNQQPLQVGFNQQPQPAVYNAQPGIGAEVESSRYQEYNMGDVVAQKKSHKKLIIILISITVAILLAVAGFFIFKFIKRSMTISKIKEQPTAFLTTAYQSTTEAICSQDEILSIVAGKSKQQTFKTTINMGSQGSETMTYAIDADNKKAYAKLDVASKSGNINAEFYSNLDRHVLKASNGANSLDFYLDSKDLKTNAASSAFGPNNPNGFGVDQKTYDTFTDVYEYVYNNLSKDGDDTFGLKTLGEKICADVDKCGNVEVKEDKADIFGQNTDSIVITHTFKDTSIVDALYVDLKDWANNNININAEINSAVQKAFQEIDPMKFKSYLGSSNFDVVIHHFINKDTSKIMKVEISVTAEGKTVVLSATFGVDPSTSNKITFEATAMGIGEIITIERQSDSSQDKYNINFSGLALVGDVTFTRNKSTGEFNVNSTVTSPFGSSAGNAQLANLSTSGSDVEIQKTGNNFAIPSVSGNLSDFTGTIKRDGNSVVFTLIPKNNSDGMSIEYTISNTAEITEISSENDILKASRDQIENSFKNVFSAASASGTGLRF